MVQCFFSLQENKYSWKNVERRYAGLKHMNLHSFDLQDIDSKWVCRMRIQSHSEMLDAYLPIAYDASLSGPVSIFPLGRLHR